MVWGGNIREEYIFRKNIITTKVLTDPAVVGSEHQNSEVSPSRQKPRSPSQMQKRSKSRHRSAMSPMRPRPSALRTVYLPIKGSYIKFMFILYVVYKLAIRSTTRDKEYRRPPNENSKPLCNPRRRKFHFSRKSQ